MNYLLAFLEGIITFISPCFLPMIPIYILYFSADKNTEVKRSKTIVNAIGFVTGFTIIFVILGLISAMFGNLIMQYMDIIGIVFGIVIIMFGINFMGIIKIPLLNKIKKINKKVKINGFFSAVLFGMVFSIGWTPCVGAFLSTILFSASVSGELLAGGLQLFVYSMGIGIPLIITVVLIDQLKKTFDFIKKNYNKINFISRIILNNYWHLYGSKCFYKIIYLKWGIVN